MKKTALVLMYAISMASFATAPLNKDSSSKQISGQNVLLASTVSSAKNSAAMTTHVAVIAKQVTASIG